MTAPLGTLSERRVEIDDSDRRVTRLRFFDGEEYAGERLSLDEFTTRIWRRFWLEGRVDDPDRLEVLR